MHALSCSSFESNRPNKISGYFSDNKQINSQDSLVLKIDSLEKLATLYHTKGLYYNKVNIDSAIIMTRKSIQLRESIHGDEPNFFIGKSYHNLGFFFKKKGEYNLAKSNFLKAVSIFKVVDQERVLKAYFELGKLYDSESDYHSAEKYYKPIVYTDLELKKKQLRFQAIVNLGGVYSNTSRNKEALALLEPHKYVFEDSIFIDFGLLNEYQNNLAIAYQNNGNYHKAINTYEKILANEVDIDLRIKACLNMSSAYHNIDKPELGLIALKKGIAIAKKSNNKELIAFSYAGLAVHFQKEENYVKVLHEFQRTIDVLLPRFTPENDLDLPTEEELQGVVHKVDLLDYIDEKANTLIILDRHKYRDQIKEIYRLGDKIINDIRSDHLLDVTKLFWRQKVHTFYESAIAYAHFQNDVNEAFYFFEKSKSVLLLEGISFNETLLNLSKQELEKFYDLKEDCLMHQSSSGQLIDVVESQQELEQYIEVLEKKYPRIFSKQQAPFILSLEEFKNKKVMDSTSMYIHYFYGTHFVYAMSITKNESKIIELGSYEDINREVQDVLNFYQHSSQISNSPDSFASVSHTLYESILSPLIEGEIQEVIIFPHGEFFELPFESLISEYSSGNIRYLIEDVLIRYSFSGSILCNSVPATKDGKDDIVAFMPFSSDLQSNNIPQANMGDDIFNTDELDHLKVKYFRGKEATKSNLLLCDNKYSVLHFSSHGFGGENEISNILLSDKPFTISALYATSMTYDLVVLSACKTNLGKTADGEGMLNMTRGFTYAGSKSVISSLWDVLAVPTSIIVKLFYTELNSGEDKASALRNAKLAYLNDPSIVSYEKSPYYWSGLSFYGQNNTIPFRTKDNNLLMKISFGLILTLSIILLIVYQYVVRGQISKP